MNPLKNMPSMNAHLEEEIKQETAKLLISDNLESNDYRESLPRLYIGEVPPDDPKDDDHWYYSGSEPGLYEYYSGEWLYLNKTIFIIGRTLRDVLRSWAYARGLRFPHYKIISDNVIRGISDGIWINLGDSRVDERIQRELDQRGFNELDGRSPEERLTVLRAINDGY